MEQPCLLDYCFEACLPLEHFGYIFHHVFFYTLHLRAHFSTDELVPCSACAHRLMLGLEMRPRPAGAQSDAALPGSGSSYLPLPSRKGQDCFSGVTPTSSVAQPAFTTLSLSYKNSFFLCSGWRWGWWGGGGGGL